MCLKSEARIWNVLNNYEQHPLVFSHGVLGFQSFPGTDLFCVPANGDNNFLSYGIVENTLLIVDRKKLFWETALNIFQTAQMSHGAAQLKLSSVWLADASYVGRVILSANLYS